MSLNWRWSGVAATAAFSLSVMFGILGGVGFSAILVRAALGAAIFAGVGLVLFVLVSQFLPELLVNATEPASGQRVNISVEGDLASDLDESVAVAVDGNDLDGLVEEVEESSAEEDGLGAVDPVSDFDVGGETDRLPDMDSFAGSFESELPVESAKGGGVEQDRDPETLARVVQTLLKRDQKG